MPKRIEVSRRTALQGGLAAASALVAGRASADADDPVSKRLPADPRDQVAQVSKERVHYQWTPNEQGSKCSICSNFVAPISCKVVSGTISPEGYCLVFAPTDIDLNKSLPPA